MLRIMESNPSLREHLEKVETEGPLTEAHKKLLTALQEAEKREKSAQTEPAQK